MPWRELLKVDAISKLLRDPLEASSGSERGASRRPEVGTSCRPAIGNRPTRWK
jgi:hypothetical protein